MQREDAHADDARARAVAWVDAWVGRPALERLALAFDGPARDSASTAQWLAALEAFSSRWDFRNGQERNLTKEQSFDPELTELVLAAAEELDLRGPDHPPQQDYDAIVILGGLVRASLARPRYAAQLWRSGTVRTPRVVGLGGHRKLDGDEIDMERRLIGADVSDEFEAMDSGMRFAFDVDRPIRVDGEESETLGAGWAVREYRAADGLAVDVIAAPSSTPGFRATTPDTYHWLAERSGLVRRGDRLLIITTRIYRPFQEADAWRMFRLEHGIDIDVVGIDPGAVDPRLAQPFTAQAYLQETRSAIRAMRALREAATAAVPSG